MHLAVLILACVAILLAVIALFPPAREWPTIPVAVLLLAIGVLLLSR